MRRDGDRRRYAVAYLCSILIHAVALVLVVLFVVHAILNDTAPEAAYAPDTTIEVTPPSAPPTRAPSPMPSRAPLHMPRPPRPRPVAVLHPAPHELAHIVKHAPPQPRAHPLATAPPSAAPVRLASVATAAPTQAPTVAPTVAPTAAPTIRPTVEPTAPPTPEPTARPTVEPTAPPTARPTVEPTAPPTAAPTARPTIVPAAPHATIAPVVAHVASVGPSPHAGPVGGPADGTASRALGGAGSAVRAPGSPAAAPAAPAAPHAAASAPAGPDLTSLNARMRAALPTAPVDATKHYDLGGYHTDRVLDAYEASLAPPLEVLLKTFGLIYTKRTAAQADSIAYVYERTRVLGVEVCRAYTIVEHPLRVAGPNADHIGPAGQAMSGRPSAVDFPGPLPDLKPEISTEVVPCNAKGMIPVVPGSMTSPAPRRPGLETPSPAP